ncbi:disease resistance protein RPV1-like isoform X2 [Benincasa hispida]|uniref:disease resistance protein RPV1-like isoform X2 n=1 Tax=Benincasa hispida TaxID=102211 RepID=UPI0018FFE99F|nr:disease resistance protein RPV1-like isoform X2 [Benincasa hispida]XP_038891074.1 disease resistance protein RPV1-like isoform X2 [Benincasa hispida]XP_038891075.1 disease resistance protein RPV1-like isoform X2 [Benincasa hispida]
MSFDIFISFRGKDTRNTFTGHLYKELVELGISTFMDDKKLLIGDSLSEKLIRAIEKSWSFIVVLSENYASSKWCLRELVKIIDCMAVQKHRVIPVFYHVNPRDVRHQLGCFKKSFRKHEEILQELNNMERDKYMKEVQQWRRALTKVGDLSGVVVTKDSVEVASIGKITKQLLDILNHQMLVASDKVDRLVDMERRLSKMDELIDLESNDVRFVGITGMGGIGKTTIAEVFYDKVANKFGKNHCFLRIYERTLVSLQQQLLSQLLRTKDIVINNENEGARMIESYLKGKKVFIALDGVKEISQLEMLVGSPIWFGQGSKIIITTRNRDVLRQPNYRDIMVEYNVEFLDYESAMSLFCKHAFGSEFPNRNFEDLSKEIVERVKGHPQALIQIGLSLYDKGIDIWKEELKSLEKDYMNKHLFKTLKISFDDLGKTSQEVFLDLACFFNGKKKEKVIEILKSFDYRPHSELKLLEDRCLIEVRRDNTIFMPNCIQAMGQEIERGADKRSRIWLPKDAIDAFDQRHRVRDIKGIVLEMEEKQDEVELEGKVFEDMTCLKILQISNVKVIGDFTHLSKQLRLLNWHSYPSECLPLRFDSRYLFQLLLPLSQTRQLWNGQKGFEKLKLINVSDSKNLRETPNFTKVPNLESLVLSNCTRLWKIDSSISRLNRLTLLDLTCCINLKSLPSIQSCKSLTTLNLAGSGLECLDQKGLEHFQNVFQLFQAKRRSTRIPSMENLRE